MKRLKCFILAIAILFTGCGKEVVVKETLQTKKLEVEQKEVEKKVSEKPEKVEEVKDEKKMAAFKSIVNEINKKRLDQLSGDIGAEYNSDEWIKEEENVFTEEEISRYLKYQEEISGGKYVRKDPFERYKEYKRVTKEEAIEDVEYLFKLFKHCYGPYEYFNVDDAFAHAKENIIKEIKELDKDEIKAFELSNMIAKNVEFIKDDHFYLAGGHRLRSIRDIRESRYISKKRFLKEEGKYYPIEEREKENRRYIVTIDDNNDIDNYMRRTINPDGSIVYGVSFSKNWQNFSEKFKIEYDNNDIEYDAMKIPSKYYMPKGDAFEYGEKSGVPYIKLSKVSKTNKDDDSLDRFIESGEKVKDEKVVILDLRGNTGGYSSFTEQWIYNYLGEEHNIEGRDYWKNGDLIDALDKKKYKSSFYDASYELDDRKTNEGKHLIVLIDKYVASAGEYFVEDLMGIDNVVIIGQNTRGALRGVGMLDYELSNSTIQTSMGNVLHFPTIKGYEEYIGIEPDFVVSNNVALKLAIKMIKYYDMN